MRGFPASSYIFLPGNRFDPPRAGIIPTIFILDSFCAKKGRVVPFPFKYVSYCAIRYSIKLATVNPDAPFGVPLISFSRYAGPAISM